MRICVFGAGAVGSHVAVKLALAHPQDIDQKKVDAMPPERMRHFAMTLEIGKEVMREKAGAGVS